MFTNFPKIIAEILNNLPKNDYPVLNTHLFVSCWLGFILDQSLTSMRGLFFLLNARDIEVDRTTFIKASQTRNSAIFQEILNKLTQKLRQKNNKFNQKELALFPLDSTIITLTSKLLWCQEYYQVKLFCGLNSLTSEIGGISIYFGQGHDSKFGNETIDNIPENAVGIMDRGFCSLDRIANLLSRKNKYFLLRIKKNISKEKGENNQWIIGKRNQKVSVRLISFSELESKTEYYLVTNLPESEISDEEVSEIYRKRWAIETLWKFLKMHLKLDKLICKNTNGITLQIYSCLIIYLVLQLVEIPPEIGPKALDKLRYLQAFMSEKISYIHWFRRISLAR